MIYLFPVAFVLVLARFLFWLHRATVKRRARVKVRLYKKMAEKRLDQWDLARIMGVDPAFVHGLLTGDQRIEAVAAGGLILAFPESSLDYWFSLDSL